MRYFILENDPVFTDLPLLNDWGSKISPDLIRRGQSRRLPFRELIHVYPNQNVVFNGIIIKPFMLLTKEIKDIVSKYQSGIVYKEIVLLETKIEVSQLYFLAVLEEIDCLHESTVFNRVKTRIEKPVLIYETIKDHSLFEIAGTKSTHYIVRLDLAESLLRRGVRGLKLTQVELC